MTNKKRIPCRVCGKLFEPCATCQAHNNMFRWRNFACSIKCAEKYISETIAYRNSSKKDIGKINNVVGDISSATGIGVRTGIGADSIRTAKKKYNSKKTADNVGIINEESEQIV